MKLLTFILAAILFASCNHKTPSPNVSVVEYFNYGGLVESAGVKMIPIHTAVGDFKVWTKRFGNNPKIKILLLHGGPAMTHEYMECFETFFQREGFEFYEYDQLGSYYSDQPKDSTLWTTARFVEEEATGSAGYWCRQHKFLCAWKFMGWYPCHGIRP